MTLNKFHLFKYYPTMKLYLDMGLLSFTMNNKLSVLSVLTPLYTTI